MIFLKKWIPNYILMKCKRNFFLTVNAGQSLKKHYPVLNYMTATFLKARYTLVPLMDMNSWIMQYYYSVKRMIRYWYY